MWLVEYFKQFEGAPQKIRDIEAAAREAGLWFSKGTFDRAREMAGVQPVSAAQLKAILGDECDWLPSEDRPPKAAWVRLVVNPGPQLPSE